MLGLVNAKDEFKYAGASRLHFTVGTDCEASAMQRLHKLCQNLWHCRLYAVINVRLVSSMLRRKRSCTDVSNTGEIRHHLSPYLVLNERFRLSPQVLDFVWC
jgi:hypothetical protein